MVVALMKQKQFKTMENDEQQFPVIEVINTIVILIVVLCDNYSFFKKTVKWLKQETYL